MGDTAAAGTPRATAFDAPTRTDTNAWHSAPLGSPAAKDWDDSSGDAAATTFKADLCKYARMADTLLAQFWLAIREQDTAKVQRLGAYGEHGKGSLEQLYDEVQGRFSENATVSKSLYVALHHAFEAFDKFAQDQLFDQEREEQAASSAAHGCKLGGGVVCCVAVSIGTIAWVELSLWPRNHPAAGGAQIRRGERSQKCRHEQSGST